MKEFILYRGGYKYQLAETYVCQTEIRPPQDIATEFILLNRFGILTVKRGYAFDGPSGPAIDTPSAMRGSLIHDAGYQLLRLGLLSQSTRRQWDALYKQACLEDGMWKIRAWAHFDVLRMFGANAAKVGSEPGVLRAP